MNRNQKLCSQDYLGFYLHHDGRYGSEPDPHPFGPSSSTPVRQRGFSESDFVPRGDARDLHLSWRSGRHRPLENGAIPGTTRSESNEVLRNSRRQPQRYFPDTSSAQSPIGTLRSYRPRIRASRTRNLGGRRTQALCRQPSTLGGNYVPKDDSVRYSETRNRLWNGSVNTGILMRDETDPETANRYFRKVDSVLSVTTEPSEQAYRNFQRHVDRLCLLIVASDCSDREIDIERLHLRVQVAALFPKKMPLYDMVYESRFRRLRLQFRERP